MMETKQYPPRTVIVGGDGRMIYTKNALAAKGWSVSRWEDSSEDALAHRLKEAELVLLPIPLTRDGVHLHAPMAKVPPMLSEIIEWLSPGQVLAAGNCPDAFADAVRSKGCVLFDYGKSDAYAIRGALATAEGAIALAITHSPVTLAGSQAAILGFGRIGKQLCRLLLAMGARVTVFARREGDLAFAEAMGAKAVQIAQMGEETGRHSLVFNTVPVKLLGRDEFARLGEDALFFDLAPVYEAVDGRIIRCPALPYRFSPKSAGELIADCVDGLAKRGEGAR